ncbi:exonuclease [Mycobacterium phage Evanesce]|uniref:Exonuclease n=1 Tax=Mycobacterium phage Evanesce TaxID=1718174 RepID=A0A0M4S2Q2_9CAUD|nr:exonuclease [Mycobacterium phage Evanesce]
MMDAPLLFLDIETLGVTPGAAIWEVAAARFEGERLVGHMHAFVLHDPNHLDRGLPEAYARDYANRYDDAAALHPETVLATLDRFAEGRAIVCGSNPRFDMDRLEALAADEGVSAPGWHYHPNDIPGMVHGYLLGRGIAPAPPWRTDFMSQCIGVDPRDYDRHTAEGDVWWTVAMRHAITERAAR